MSSQNSWFAHHVWQRRCFTVHLLTSAILQIICSSSLLLLRVPTCLRWTKQLSQRYQVTTVHFKNSQPLYDVCSSTALETCQKTGNLPNLQSLRVKFAFRSHFWGHMSRCFVYDRISILGDGMFPSFTI